MEAALFAADLFNMYQKVAVLNGWRFIGGFSHPSDSSYEFTAKRKISQDAGGNLEKTFRPTIDAIISLQPPPSLFDKFII